jgi:hypothetical protein
VSAKEETIFLFFFWRECQRRNYFSFFRGRTTDLFNPSQARSHKHNLKIQFRCICEWALPASAIVYVISKR